MTHEPRQLDEETRLARLLATVARDVPPPDVESLARLRERSLAAFAEAPPSAPGGGRSSSLPDAIQATPKGTPMLSTALRLLLALSAAVAFVAWLGFMASGTFASTVTFGEVLEQLRRVESLQLRLERQDQTADVWIKAPGLVRVEESATRYQIAAGSRLWRIDEERQTTEEADSPWFVSASEQIDLLRLLDVGVADGSKLLAARALRRERFEQRDCLVFEVTVPAGTAGEPRELRLEAFADTKSRQFVALRAWPGDRDGALPGARAGRRPLAELRLIARDVAIDDDQFAVAKNLTDDGRIGKILEAQGLVVLRPMTARRWTPLGPGTLLEPGDWLRVDLRGANAVKIGLVSHVELTLGPGALLECVSPTSARLHAGFAQVRVPDDFANQKFQLFAPRDGREELARSGKTMWRVDRDEKLAAVKQAPVWLAGFEGTSAQESLGSLIVNLPDGRNEPLSVGEHKVSVEIRDQIARTTIEETFVNHTAARLEGVFHFPLPQDASISGFGMWIGNELIEADVVEKQRAREIYETILREKRDPGLLEWTSGNLFKARVFPIEPRSEKRVKIVYTQVLPLRADRYRYSYGLRSEMLRTKPLRELSLTVTVNSALPLKNIACTSHSARTQRTAHSGRVEFTAQEYVPTRDFEVVCDLDRTQSDVVVVPHRRGDDGYFLLQLTPPTGEGNWQREVLPDGQPLRLVLLCDTSGSMDGEKRSLQTEFVAAVLAALGPNDRFQLAACDVRTEWATPEPTQATTETIAAALEFLDDRLSLGWTDLDQAFAEVTRKAPADAQIIYVGDGIVSARDGDPAAFVARLRRSLTNPEAAPQKREKNAPAPARRTVHAVSVGNTTESTVLRGIAAAGRGSTRAIGGEQTPRTVAFELLNEIARPGLRDVQIEFRGLRTAAVYPERIPNLPAGTQQILVGRYLPEGKDQRGEVIVSGLLGDKPVRYSATVQLADAETGNSFIPRLWARAHLDQLLAHGSGATVREDILRLSEEFHIITPYTSLLVLETDADRERFGVKRRFEMRDGERFFADGRASANFELVQAQRKLAGNWRLGLRRKILADLAGLGRDAARTNWFTHGAPPRSFGFASSETVLFDNSRRFSSGSAMWGGEMLGRYGGVGGGMGGMGGGGFGGGLGGLGGAFGDGDADFVVSVGQEGALELSESSPAEESREEEAAEESVEQLVVEEETLSLVVGLKQRRRNQLYKDAIMGWDVEDDLDGTQLAFDGEFNGNFGDVNGRRRLPSLLVLSDSLFEAVEPEGDEHWRRELSKQVRQQGGFGHWIERPSHLAWLDDLFPPLGRAVRPAQPLPAPTTWSPEAVALAKSLSRRDSLAKLAGGVELREVVDTNDPHWKRAADRTERFVLAGAQGWLVKPLDPRTPQTIEFCDATRRGTYSRMLQLGRTRRSLPYELTEFPLGLSDGSLDSLLEANVTAKARVEAAGEGRARLVISAESPFGHEYRYLVDTARKVVLKSETLASDKLVSTTTYEDFLEVAGSWWARRVIETDATGQVLRTRKYEIQSHAPDQFAQRMADERRAEATVQFLQLPFTPLKTARQRTADGAVGFDDRVAMILEAASLQQWDDVLTHVTAIEKDSRQPGVRWIRTALLPLARRPEETRQRLVEEARRLATTPVADDLPLAQFLVQRVSAVAGPAEKLEVVNLLKPVFERQPVELQGSLAWSDHVASCLDGLGRRDEALTHRKRIAEAQPWVYSRQLEVAQLLAAAGDYEAAHAWLARALALRQDRARHERHELQRGIVDLYRRQARWDDLVNFTRDWMNESADAGGHDSAYQHHLLALLYANQYDAAITLAEGWLKDVRDNAELTDVRRARLDAALSFARGQLPGIWLHRADPRWAAPLAETLRVLQGRPADFSYAATIVGNPALANSELLDRFRDEWLRRLQSDVATLSVTQLQSFVGWTLDGRFELAEPRDGRRQVTAAEIPDAVWAKIAADVKARWERTQDLDDKHSLGETLASIYARRFPQTEYLPYLRQRLDTKDVRWRRQYVQNLFDVLLTTEWSEAREVEAFARLQELSEEKEPIERLIDELPELHRLTDAMLERRQQAFEKKLTDQGGLDKLTRRELATKKAEFLKQAKTGLSQRLAAEAQRAPEPLADWLRLEKAWIDLRLGENLADAEAHCWKLLGKEPPLPRTADPIEEPRGPELRREFLTSTVSHRAWSTILYLAARRTAPAATVARTIQYVDAGIARRDARSAAWKQAKYGLLIALDRPDDLERELRQWIRDDESTAPWRVSLGKLLAERGQLDEAIQIYESCQKDKLLSSADVRALSDWYQVRDRRADHERALRESYRLAPERSLARQIMHERNRCMNPGPVPTELDENVLLAFQVIFEKSSQPQGYCHHLREMYAATRDFRLLAILPDALLGQTAERTYALIGAIQSQVLGELRNEAAADELLARVKTLRERKLTPLDLRALDLLEALVERQAAELQNQAGPHVDASLAALRRAFDREWRDGERLLMGRWLSSLGSVSQERLRDEQLRQLRELLKGIPAGRDHLELTNELARALYFHYSRQEEGLRELAAEIDVFVPTRKGEWPGGDQQVAYSYLSMLELSGRHATAEKLLDQWEAQAAHAGVKNECRARRLQVYVHALEHDGTVSLGEGRVGIFRPLVARLEQELVAQSDENERRQLVEHWMTVLDIAQRHKLAGLREETARLAFEVIPREAPRQTSQYLNTVNVNVQLFHNVLGPAAVLRYCIERLEQYPRWLEATGQDPWAQFGFRMASSREESKDATLEPRVLKLSVARIKRLLLAGESLPDSIFHRGHQHFWEAKTADFARAAEEALAERPDSGRLTLRVAGYLRTGLGLTRRAHEILFLADHRGILDESEQLNHARWLMEDHREIEAIPLWERFVKRQPDVISHRTALMVAYHAAQRPEAVEKTLQDAVEHFHRDGRWTIDVMDDLAHGCHACDLDEQAAAYFQELISLYQRTHGAGANDATLSGHYQSLADVFADLGKTKEAVDAASAAIVTWSSRHEERRQAIDALKNVLSQSPDLNAYVATLDEDTAKTGQDSPLLRKLLGQTYAARDEQAAAVKQFRLALELQPTDAEVHQALIAAYDALEDPAAATRQLLALIDLKRSDLSLYEQLVERLAENEAEAERAATSLVEAAPNEAENHAKLAERRQQQNRWSEAIPHWRRVAELRRLEPTGLLKLAEAQLHEKQWEDARQTLGTLERTEWPERFREVPGELTRLRALLPK